MSAGGISQQHWQEVLLSGTPQAFRGLGAERLGAQIGSLVRLTSLTASPLLEL